MAVSQNSFCIHWNKWQNFKRYKNLCFYTFSTVSVLVKKMDKVTIMLKDQIIFSCDNKWNLEVPAPLPTNHNTRYNCLELWCGTQHCKEITFDLFAMISSIALRQSESSQTRQDKTLKGSITLGQKVYWLFHTSTQTNYQSWHQQCYLFILYWLFSLI